jgi:mannonate dehydratase
VCGAAATHAEFPGKVRLLLPTVIYATPGVETNIYFDNIVLAANSADYVFDVRCDKGSMYADRWTYTPAREDAGDYPLTIEVRHSSNGVVARTDAMIRAAAGTAGANAPVSLLAVGDTLTQASVYTESFATATGPLSRTGVFKDDLIGSPFLYSEGSKRLDFGRYCAQFNGGKGPDFVTFTLGTNDIAYADDSTIEQPLNESLHYFDALVAMVREFSPSMKIGVLLIIPPSISQDGFEHYDGANRPTRWQFRRNQHLFVELLMQRFGGRENENIYVVRAYSNLDAAHNFPTRPSRWNAENPEMVERVVDGNHPSAAGYRQMRHNLLLAEGLSRTSTEALMTGEWTGAKLAKRGEHRKFGVIGELQNQFPRIQYYNSQNKIPEVASNAIRGLLRCSPIQAIASTVSASGATPISLSCNSGDTMRVAMAVVPYRDENLATVKQIGVNDIVYYDMRRMPVGEELKKEVDRLRKLDLSMTVVESGPPIDRIVLGKQGRDQQIEHFKRALGDMGKVGVEVVCYNFMPQVTADAMVVRTTYAGRARGNAETTAFRASDLSSATVPHSETPISAEAMWDNLESFLKEVIPAAEGAGVKLAMHPDDPPLSPICKLNRIMSSVESFDRLLSISSSPANGITLCMGCFLEMGADPAEIARRFRDRVQFVHFRDVAGVPTDFVETFLDDGPTDFTRIFETFRDLGWQSPIRVDHVPRLALEDGKNDGYGFVGHLYGTGYLIGLLEPVFGKRSLEKWRTVLADKRASSYLGA